MDLHILLQTIPTALKGEGQQVGQSAAEVDDLGPAKARTEQRLA
jgi:hypothetical protein